MDNKQIVNYVKRTQRDYTLTLKLEIVREVESGELSVTGVKRKYGIQRRSLSKRLNY
jgi:transposase-like protein